MKDVDRRRDNDDDRENTNGDDRKGSFTDSWDSEKRLIHHFSRRGISYPCSRRARYCRVANLHAHAAQIR